MNSNSLEFKNQPPAWESWGQFVGAVISSKVAAVGAVCHVHAEVQVVGDPERPNEWSVQVTVTPPMLPSPAAQPLTSHRGVGATDGLGILNRRFPVLAAWLPLVLGDLKEMTGRSVVQYGIYLPGDGFATVMPVDAWRVDVRKILEAADRAVGVEADLEMICVHLDDGTQFYIRPEDAYEGEGGRSPRWLDLVHSCRELHDPESDGAAAG